jgi:hypothetical protein
VNLARVHFVATLVLFVALLNGARFNKSTCRFYFVVRSGEQMKTPLSRQDPRGY